MKKSSGCLKITNQTMKKQILLLTFLILILTISLVSLIVYINNQLVLPKFTESSEVMYLKTTKQNLQSNLFWYKSIILKTLEISIHNKQVDGLELITFHRLYNEAHKMVKSMDPIILNEEMNMQFGGVKNMPEMLWTKEGYGGYNTSNSFLCYSNLSQLADPLTYDQKVGIKIQEYFQAFGQMVYLGNLIKQEFVYFYTIADNMNFIYPCLNRGEKIYKYFPQTRNWYVDALDLYHTHNLTDYTYLLTKTYILYTGQTLGLSMYLPIINQAKQFIGSMGTNILSSEFSSYFKGNHRISMVLLVEEEGTLIVHNFTVNFSDLPLMIYNQQLTGFNLDDWNYFIKKEGQTQCKSFQSINQLRCVHNTLFNQDVLVEVTFLEQYKLYLIIFQDTTELLQFQNIQQNTIQDFFTSYLIQSIMYVIYFFLFFALLIIWAIMLIMGPVHKITKSIYKKMYSNEWGLEKVNGLQKMILSQTLQDFYNSYLKFMRKISGVLPQKKSEICLQIENLEYPSTIYIFKKQILNQRMKFIFNKGYNLDNINSNPVLCQNLKIIITALKNITTKIKI